MSQRGLDSRRMVYSAVLPCSPSIHRAHCCNLTWLSLCCLKCTVHSIQRWLVWTQYFSAWQCTEQCMTAFTCLHVQVPQGACRDHGCELGICEGTRVLPGCLQSWEHIARGLNARPKKCVHDRGALSGCLQSWEHTSHKDATQGNHENTLHKDFTRGVQTWALGAELLCELV